MESISCVQPWITHVNLLSLALGQAVSKLMLNEDLVIVRQRGTYWVSVIQWSWPMTCRIEVMMKKTTKFPNIINETTTTSYKTQKPTGNKSLEELGQNNIDRAYNFRSEWSVNRAMTCSGNLVVTNVE